MEHVVMDTSVADRNWPEWQHKVTRQTNCRTKGYAGYLIRAKAGLCYLRGNRLPYFSVTGEIFQPGERDIKAGGCLHDEIRAHFPELAPVIALHLSDADGTPMHAAGNGWYYLAGYYGGAGERYHFGNSTPPRDPEECLRVFAEHVRVTVDDARALADSWQRGVPYDEAKGPCLEWIEAQRPRWKAEADAVIALLDSLKGESK